MSNARKRPSRLGKGLSSLMAQSVPTDPPADTDDAPAAPPAGRADSASPSAAPAPEARTGTAATTLDGDGERDADTHTAALPREAGGDGDGDAGPGPLRYVPIDRLAANPHQPRQRFDEASLGRLAESIRADGMMQPIVARPATGDGHTDADADGDGGARYEIVAGERRWRAAKLAGLDRVPTIVRELDDQALAEWALIENLQREDLNPIERAEAFQRLGERFGLGHDEIARRVGMERSTISNLLRLLQLSDVVKGHVRDGKLSMGQARAIAGVADAARQQQLAERAVRQGLSVRQVEQLARAAASQPGGANGAAAGDEPSRGQVRSAYLADLEQQLTEQLQTRVKLRPGRKKGSGSLTIEFYTLDQFDALMEKLGVRTG